jgi:hypothetical protein
LALQQVEHPETQRHERADEQHARAHLEPADRQATLQLPESEGRRLAQQGLGDHRQERRGRRPGGVGQARSGDECEEQAAEQRAAQVHPQSVAHQVRPFEGRAEEALDLSRR